MIYLLITSLIWALSFGLIKTYLVGFDPLVVAAVRLTLALLVFVPWLRVRRVGLDRALRCMLLGSIQFGVMYWLYIKSYQYLPAYVVAVFTIFTPLYVVLIESVWSRTWSWRFLVAALLAIGGAAVIVVKTFDAPAELTGIGLLQIANLCFAVGQLGFRRLAGKGSPTEAGLIAFMYLGAALLIGGAALLFGDLSGFKLQTDSGLALLYLGIIPTGIGFFLWNKGAARTAPGVLAAANNLKIPLAVLAAWLIFGEEADYVRVLFGLGLILVGLLTATVTRRSLTAGTSP